jgi:ribosomal protein S18 acetylase RimI-like enzyme
VTGIRRATAADLPAIGRLGTCLIEQHHAFDPRRFLAPRGGTPAAYASFLATQIDDPDAIVLVADDEGSVVGYAYAAVEGYDYMALRGPAGVLHDVLVDADRRGRGLGRLLLEAILAELRPRVPAVVLFTAVGNEGAQRLFENLGFRPTMIEMTREL